MLNLLVGWVRLTEPQLLSANMISLPDQVWIAECLNPTPHLTLSSYALFINDNVSCQFFTPTVAPIAVTQHAPTALASLAASL